RELGRRERGATRIEHTVECSAGNGSSHREPVEDVSCEDMTVGEVCALLDDCCQTREASRIVRVRAGGRLVREQLPDSRRLLGIPGHPAGDLIAQLERILVVALL